MTERFWPGSLAVPCGAEFQWIHSRVPGPAIRYTCRNCGWESRTYIDWDHEYPQHSPPQWVYWLTEFHQVQDGTSE